MLQGNCIGLLYYSDVSYAMLRLYDYYTANKVKAGTQISTNDDKKKYDLRFLRLLRFASRSFLPGDEDDSGQGTRETVEEEYDSKIPHRSRIDWNPPAPSLRLRVRDAGTQNSSLENR